MKTFLVELFEYNHKVNQLSIQAIITQNEKINEPIIRSINHILLAHRSWNLRMKEKPGLAELWQGIDLQELESFDKKNNHVTFQIMLSLNEMLDASFQYKNSKGISFENVYRDVLFHLINHSTYHRGQLNMELKKIGLEPVVNDFVFYKR